MSLVCPTRECRRRRAWMSQILIVLSSAPATRNRESGLKHTLRTYESPSSSCSSAACDSTTPWLAKRASLSPVSASYKTAALWHPVATYRPLLLKRTQQTTESWSRVCCSSMFVLTAAVGFCTTFQSSRGLPLLSIGHSPCAAACPSPIFAAAPNAAPTRGNAAASPPGRAVGEGPPAALWPSNIWASAAPSSCAAAAGFGCAPMLSSCCLSRRISSSCMALTERWVLSSSLRLCCSSVSSETCASSLRS
mmetsp:Transcript_62343/g.149930  ORF Transcript_62343/g.149930 Transcript_62343/m.149930 type:complete len:250 (-) Transcript_62343:257-1006(-)